MAQATNGVSNLVRPQSLEEVIGLEHIKQTLKYDIEGSIKLRQPLNSYLITGPTGAGKTTIAGIIANTTNGDLHKYIGTELKSPDDIYNIVPNVEDHDVIFIEEAHGLGKNAQIILLEWIENFKIIGGGNAGLMEAPKCCFVFATTNPGKLAKPLRERCRQLQVGYYSIDLLKQILAKAGTKFDMNLSTDDDALTLLAQSSRGTPRTAVLHRLDLLRKVMAVDNLEYKYDTVKHMLDANAINEWGLEANDMVYCNTLYDKSVDANNRPVSKKIMSQCTGFDDDLIDIIEGYLFQIGAIRIQSQGRSLTDFGFELIDKVPIQTAAGTAQTYRRSAVIDTDKLRTLVEDESVRKKGMKGLMPEFGLRYGPDNSIMRTALERIGYTCRKRAGIVSNAGT